MKKNASRIIIVLVILISILILASVPTGRYISLRSFKNEVHNVLLPQNIEKIAIKSAIGDSGGNGDYSTLRVVLLVKTELDLSELKSAIKINFPQYDKDNMPIYFVTNCLSQTFKSAREFTLDFNELEENVDFSNYYFIEFVR